MFQDIYAHALKLLSRRNYFTAELSEALDKKFPGGRLDDVIDQLIKDRYLNDEEYFKDFVRWRAESLYGPYYIKEKLRLKNVDKSVGEISGVLEELEIDKDLLLRKAIEKYKRTRGSKKDNFRRSCLSWLAGRGFAISDCIKILDQEVKDESNFFEGC